jgi:hypothetical protein
MCLKLLILFPFSFSFVCRVFLLFVWCVSLGEAWIGSHIWAPPPPPPPPAEARNYSTTNVRLGGVRAPAFFDADKTATRR